MDFTSWATTLCVNPKYWTFLDSVYLITFSVERRGIDNYGFSLKLSDMKTRFSDN